MLGHPPTLAEHESADEGLGRYFRLCTDHKVVAMQYMVGIGFFFAIGGLNAMLIRTELLSPERRTCSGANQYLTLVGLHGSMMMGMMTSAILGPFANWLVPLMIGSRRMAFPRIEAFTFWLLMAAGVILITTIFFGGFQTGWTGYEPLGAQGTAGYDAYIGFFALVGVSMSPARAQPAGDDHHDARAGDDLDAAADLRAGAVVATAILMVLASPMLTASLFMGAFDRTVQTAFFIPGNGGSRSFLWQNLFWVFGHPEVYIVALPGFGIVLELLPVFCRKPLWGYRIAVAGMLGVTLLSFFVWQHHLFVSGINADLRPFYMLSTELISIPTGFIFLCAMGTLWRGRIRLTVPMLFCSGWVFNFLFGGISGVFLSDVPSDVTTHGTFFVDGPLPLHDHGRAGVHVLRGDLLLDPEDDRLQVLGAARARSTSGRCSSRSTRRSGRCSRSASWACRDAWSRTRSNLQPLNDWVSVSAFVIGLSMLVFLWNVVSVADLQARAGGGEPVALEVARVPAADAGARPTTSIGSPCSTPTRIRTASSRSAGADRGARRRGRVAMEASAPLAAHIEPEPREWQLRAAVGRRPDAVRRRRVLLHGVPVRVLLPALARRQQELEDRRRSTRRRASAWRSWSCWWLSAVLLRMASRRPTDALSLGLTALVLALLSIVLQLSSGPRSASGRRAAATRACTSAGPPGTRCSRWRCVYWIETQIASIWRLGREGVKRPRAEGVPADDVELLGAGLEACSFFWAFYVALGVIAWIVLYLV